MGDSLNTNSSSSLASTSAHKNIFKDFKNTYNDTKRSDQGLYVKVKFYVLILLLIIPLPVIVMGLMPGKNLLDELGSKGDPLSAATLSCSIIFLVSSIFALLLALNLKRTSNNDFAKSFLRAAAILLCVCIFEDVLDSIDVAFTLTGFNNGSTEIFSDIAQAILMIAGGWRLLNFGLVVLSMLSTTKQWKSKQNTSIIFQYTMLLALTMSVFLMCIFGGSELMDSKFDENVSLATSCFAVVIDVLAILLACNLYFKNSTKSEKLLFFINIVILTICLFEQITLLIGNSIAEVNQSDPSADRIAPEWVRNVTLILFNTTLGFKILLCLNSMYLVKRLYK